MGILGGLKKAWNKSVKPIGKKVVSNYKEVFSKGKDLVKKHSLFNKNNDLTKFLKKQKLKDVLDNKAVQAGLLGLSGGTLGPALLGYNALSAGVDSIGSMVKDSKLGSALGAIRGKVGDFGDGLEELIPSEIKGMKLKHLWDDQTTPADALLEAVTGRQIVTAGASARGRNTVRVTSRSSGASGRQQTQGRRP